MTKETVALLSVVIPAACWAGSLRRTPYSIAWAVWCIAAAVVTAAAALLCPHVTASGGGGIAVGFGLFSVIPAICTEFTAAESPSGTIGTFRKKHARTLPGERWTVYVSREGSYAEKRECEVGVRRGQSKRTVGTADPIEDMDAYADLKVRAEEIANVYNREKVQ